MSASGPKTPCSAQRVTDLINRLGRGVHCLQYADGLNPAQWEALRYIDRANRYSRNPSALATYLKITKGTASQTIKALESKGLVGRVPHCTDRRAVHLEITEEGQAALGRDPLRQLEDGIRELGGDLEPAKLMLCQLIDRLEDASGKREFGTCKECTHFCRDVAADTDCGPHQCGLTREPLSAVEAQQICVDYAV